MRNSKNGFTLIELIVVVGIIALLAVIVIVSLGSAKSQGDDAARISSVSEIKSALQIYLIDNNSYPAGDQSVLINALVKGSKRYIASINPYIFYQSTNQNGTICSSNCQSYHLGIPLSGSDNKALANDANLNVGFNGQVDNCSWGPASVPDKCYDVTP